MSKLIVSMLTTLDGFIEGPNRELDWLIDSPDFYAYCDDMLNHTDTMLLGRATYEVLASYWPAAEAKPKDDWERKLARSMNALPKIVVSRTLERADWNNTRVVRDNLAAEIRALVERAAADCFVFGGAGLVSSLRQLGLVDEYRIIVHPIALGRGKPLFADLAEPLRLQQVGCQPFDSGVVLLRYRPES
jgi:dihydrofolate reductase